MTIGCVASGYRASMVFVFLLWFLDTPLFQETIKKQKSTSLALQTHDYSHPNYLLLPFTCMC